MFELANFFQSERVRGVWKLVFMVGSLNWMDGWEGGKASCGGLSASGYFGILSP